MKIVTLMENTACRDDLKAEHGLSLYIETGAYRILFDAGQSGAFADNAEKLGVDLSKVDFAVLSHGHYDHGGGLLRFLEINSKALIFLNRHAFEPHHNAVGAYIGLDPALQKCDRLRFVEGELQIAEGISLHTLPLPPADTAGLTVMEKGVLIPEDFRHEQYLQIREKGKTILFSGCSHKGIVNIAQYFQPDLLVGGFHFVKTEEEQVLDQAARILLGNTKVCYTGHCTGQRQFAFMKQIMGQRLEELSTGRILEI